MSNNNLSSLVSFSATRENIWKTVGSASLLSSGDNALCDTSGGSYVVQLPDYPLTGATVKLMDPNGSWPTNPIRIDPQTNLLLLSHDVLSFSGSDLTLIFLGPSMGWQVYGSDTPVGLAVRSSVDQASARSALGLGSVSVQSAAGVALTGGTIDGTTIGAMVPASGSFAKLFSTTPSLTDSSSNAATTSFVYGLVTGNWLTVNGSITLDRMPANLFVDSSAGPIGIQLPPSPPQGASVVLIDSTGSWGINNVQIDPAGQNLGGDSSLLVLDAPGYLVRLTFSTSAGWYICGMKIS